MEKQMTDLEKQVKNDILLWAMANGIVITVNNSKDLIIQYWKEKLK